MTRDEKTTIFALATAAGRSGVAVMRISGRDAHSVFKILCKPEAVPVPRQAVLRRLYNPSNHDLIDRALVLWFPAPHSFTGEDVVEFHIHGGRAVQNALTEALRKIPGFRYAMAGEFTRRAFENDKLDLTEAEAIADLVNAETEAQRRQSLRQMDGALGRLYEQWRSRLMRALAYMEAAIDFADEELPADVAERHMDDLRVLEKEIVQHLNDQNRGERLREGFSIAILGQPNAGKSSLLNALAKRDVAIVSSMAGTTRDIIEIHLDIAGYPAILADTAGLRESANMVESEGIRRALQRANHADLKILVFDGQAWPAMDEPTKALMDENAIIVVNKSDLITSKIIPSSCGVDPIFLSAKTGEGISLLLDRLVNFIDVRFADTGQISLTRPRHRSALEDCLSHLRRSFTASQPELRTEDMRLAMRSLGAITGSVNVDDLLEIIFRDFCIGK